VQELLEIDVVGVAEGLDLTCGILRTEGVVVDEVRSANAFDSRKFVQEVEELDVGGARDGDIIDGGEDFYAIGWGLDCVVVDKIVGLLDFAIGPGVIDYYGFVIAGIEDIETFGILE
jgi:hypothetical protein